MKKKITVLFISLISTFLLINNVEAASASLSVRSSSTRVVVGNRIRVTVNISSSDPLGSWEYDLNYDKNLMEFVSSDVGLHYAFVASNGKTKSVSYTYNFKAKKSGSAKFYLTSTDVYGWDVSRMSTKLSSVTVNVITQTQLEASYSKDNYLKSLSVEGLSLTPEFNKEKLEYSIELEPLTTSIKLIGSKNDNNATVTGLGNIEVSEGLNKLNVVVTAQNGTKRTYTINATVKEQSPIIVNVDDQKYTVLRRMEGIFIPRTFSLSKIELDEEKIDALVNEMVDHTLLALKDEEGNVKLFQYDQDKNEYSKYEYIQFGSLTIRILKPTQKLDNFMKLNQTINDQEIEVLKENKNSKYSLIYGLNLETNKENFYSYDEEEATIQRYNQEKFTIKEKTGDYFPLLLIFAGISAVLLIVIITLLSNRKPKEKIVKEKPKKEEVKEQKQEEKPKEKKKKEKEPKPKKEKKKKQKDKLDEWFGE